MNLICSLGAVAASMLATLQPPTLPPGPEIPATEAVTLSSSEQSGIRVKKVRTQDIDPCAPPEAPCC